MSYTFRSDSHTVIASDTYTVNSTVVYDASNPRESDDVAAGVVLIALEALILKKYNKKSKEEQ